MQSPKAISSTPSVLPSSQTALFPPLPVSVRRNFSRMDSIVISISATTIDRKHVVQPSWSSGCVSHTGWSKSHAIRILIVVSIQFARHFNHPVSYVENPRCFFSFLTSLPINRVFWSFSDWSFALVQSSTPNIYV